MRVCLSNVTCQLNYINLQQYQHSGHVNIRSGNSGASRRRLLKRCGAVSGSGSAKSRIENLKLLAPTDYTADHKMSMNLVITVATRKTAEGTRPPEFSRLKIPISVFYTSVSQTVVRGPQVVLGFCPCGPFRLNISPKKTKKK